MMKKLRDITSKIGSGATPRGGKESYKDSGITLIRSLNVYDFKFEKDGLAYIDDQQANELSNVEVLPDDILLNITGASVARCCIVPRQLLPARVNQHVAIVRVNKALAEPRYVLYTINSPAYKQHLLGLAQGGATREALTKDTIGDFQVDLPSLDTQKKVSATLSAYDDLIENNTRRIQILEEMARMIYREWFVNFRFPGHEQAKFVESALGRIPEGWNVKALGELISVNALSLSPKTPPEQIKYIDIASVSPGKIEKVEELNFLEAPGRARRIVNHGDIIWSCVRPNRKSYALILNPPENLIVSTGFAVLTPASVPYTYLYLAVTTDGFVGYLTNHATGAAYPAVNTEDFKKAEILLPDERILDLFHEKIFPLLVYQQNLLKKNEVLRQTRDLLLPKLISGQVDVSDLDIQV